MVLSEKMCKFSGNALATYFNTLPSTSISMPCISPFDEKKEMLQKWVLQHLQRSLCRKEAIRTPDPYVPNVVRYQLRYFPIAPAKLVIFGDMAKVFPYFFVFTSIVILGRWGSLVMSRMRGLPRWASELLVMLIFNLAVAPGFNVPLERETLMPRL